MVFFSGELVDGIEYDMGVDVFPVCMDADDCLVSRQMLPHEFLRDLQRQFRRDLIRLESLKYEIYQYLNGVPLEELEFLTRNEQERRGIRVESLLDFRKRIHRSPWDPRPQYMISNDLTLRASIPDR